MIWLIILSSCIWIPIGFLCAHVICTYIQKRSRITTTKEYEIEWPIDFEWKFTKADLILVIKDSVDGHLRGKCFYAYNIPGLQFHLQIYPNGNNVDRRGQTWIFLYVNASMKRKIAAEYKFSIESANYLSESVNIVCEKYDGYGTAICETAKFFDCKNKFFMDEEITIKVKGILKAPRPTVSKISSPISLKWKIQEDDLREAMKPESSGRFMSKIFNIPSFNGVKYWLEMNTKVLDAQNNVSTYLYLHSGFRRFQKIEAVVEFSVDSVGFRCVFEQVYENGSGYGPLICLTGDLFDPSKRYVVDGYLTININGIFMVERNRRMTMECKNGLPQIHDPKDFMIVIGDKTIPVHKQRLMDVSPVWAGMVECGMKESIENKMVIEDFSFKIVEAAIKIFYNENGFCSLTMEEVFTLYKFADKYLVAFLLDHVEQALIKMISPSNVCQLLKLSAPNSCNVPKLHESCIIFLTKCFKESTPVYGAESLGEKFLASVFLRGFHPISDSVTHL